MLTGYAYLNKREEKGETYKNVLEEERMERKKSRDRNRRRRRGRRNT